MGELERLIEALQAYLALGEDTPVAQEAAALLAAAQAAQGEEGGPTEEPPAEEGPMDLDPMSPQEGEPPANTGARTFAEANQSALPRLEERNKKKRGKSY